MNPTAQRRPRFVTLGRVTVPKPVNLRSQKAENNGMDPNVALVPKISTNTGSVWGNPPDGPSVPVSAPPVVAPRPSMASSGPAWGGAGLPVARKDTSTVKAEDFPELAAGLDGSHSSAKLGVGEQRLDEHNRAWDGTLARNGPPFQERSQDGGQQTPQQPRGIDRKDTEAGFRQQMDSRREPIGTGRAWADQQGREPDVWVPPQQVGPPGPAGPPVQPGLGPERWRPDPRRQHMDYGRGHDRYPPYGARPQFEGNQAFYNGPGPFHHPSFRNHPGGPSQGQHPDFHVVQSRSSFPRDPQRDSHPPMDGRGPARPHLQQQFAREVHLREHVRDTMQGGGSSELQAVPSGHHGPTEPSEESSRADSQPGPYPGPLGAPGTDAASAGHFNQQPVRSGDQTHMAPVSVLTRPPESWAMHGLNPRQSYHPANMVRGVPHLSMNYQQQGHYGPPPPGGGFVQALPVHGAHRPHPGAHMGGGAPAPQGYAPYPQQGMQQPQHVVHPSGGPPLLPPPPQPAPPPLGPPQSMPTHVSAQGPAPPMQFGSYDPNNPPQSPDTGRAGVLLPHQAGPEAVPMRAVRQPQPGLEPLRPVESHQTHQQPAVHQSLQGDPMPDRKPEPAAQQAQSNRLRTTGPLLKAVPVGTPTVSEIEEQQRVAASQAEARKARPIKDSLKDEKENVPRPRDRVSRSHPGPLQRQQAPATTQRHAENGHGTNGQGEAERPATGTATVEGSSGIAQTGIKQLEEQQAFMRKRAEERKDAHKRDVRDQPKSYHKNGFVNGVHTEQLRNGESQPRRSQMRPIQGDRDRQGPRDHPNMSAGPKAGGTSAPASPRASLPGQKPPVEVRRGSEGYKRDKAPRAIPKERLAPISVPVVTSLQSSAGSRADRGAQAPPQTAGDRNEPNQANGEFSEKDGKVKNRGPRPQQPRERRDRGPRPAPADHPSAPPQGGPAGKPASVPLPDKSAPPLRNGELRQLSGPQGQRDPGPRQGPRGGMPRTEPRKLEGRGSADAPLAETVPQSTGPPPLLGGSAPQSSIGPPGIAPVLDDGNRAPRDHPQRRDRGPKKIREKRERPEMNGPRLAAPLATPPGLSSTGPHPPGTATETKTEPGRQGKPPRGGPPPGPPGLVPQVPDQDGKLRQDRRDKAPRPSQEIYHVPAERSPTDGSKNDSKATAPGTIAPAANGPMAEQRMERRQRDRKPMGPNAKSGPGLGGAQGSAEAGNGRGEWVAINPICIHTQIHTPTPTHHFWLFSETPCFLELDTNGPFYVAVISFPFRALEVSSERASIFLRPLPIHGSMWGWPFEAFKFSMLLDALPAS
eukprot:jgi/Botrbrau1/15202/Bobra.0149s0061.2